MTDTCSSCGDEIVPPDPALQITTPGGWCAPVEPLYDFPEPAPMCDDCRSRLLMVAHGLPDPGRHGENLRVRRGGVQYGRPE